MDIKQRHKLKQTIPDKNYSTINNDSTSKNPKLKIDIYSINHFPSKKRNSNSELKRINKPIQTVNNTAIPKNDPIRQKASNSFLTRVKRNQQNKAKAKEQINTINSGLVFNTINNNKYNNERTETIENYTNINGGKKYTFHVKVRSKDFNTDGIKFNNSSIMNPKNKLQNNVINLNDDNIKNNNVKLNASLNNFYNNKNVAIEKIDLYNNTNPNNAFTLINKDNQKKFKSNKIINKNFEQKRPTFSPNIDRDLLNDKQNAILNYSNKPKIDIKPSNNKPINTDYNNIIDIISSPYKKGNAKKYPVKKSNNLKLNKKNQNNQKIVGKKNIFDNTKNINKEIFRKTGKTTPINKQDFIIKKTLQSVHIISRKRDQRIIKEKKDYQNVINQDAFDEDPIMRSYTIGPKNLFTKIPKKSEILGNHEKYEEENISKESSKILEEINENKEEKNSTLEEAADNLVGDMFSDLLDNADNKNENNENETTKNTLTEAPKKHINLSKSQQDINPDFISQKFDEKKITQEKKTLKSTDPELKQIRIMDSICKKGFSGAGIKKINQDNFFMFKRFANNPFYIYFGVCDGHGLYGQDVSGYLVKHLPEKLSKMLIEDSTTNIENMELYLLSKTLTKAFTNMNDELVKSKKVDTKYSGSTCTSLIFTPSRIVTANVGDSRCVLGKFDGVNWYSKNLTRDHKPSLRSEKKRILSCNGRIEPCKDEDGEFVGPARVWLKDQNIPGLAMSRSFGDETAHLVGVISEPEIMEYYFVHEDKFLIIASDGIWEFISSDECVNVVKNYYKKNDVEGAMNYLYKEASKRWIMDEEVIDDITIILVYLN